MMQAQFAPADSLPLPQTPSWQRMLLRDGRMESYYKLQFYDAPDLRSLNTLATDEAAKDDTYDCRTCRALTAVAIMSFYSWIHE